MNLFVKKTIAIILFALPLISMAQRGERDENNQLVLTFAEQMPEFPGGDQAMYQFLSKNLRYPQDMRRQQIEAKSICYLCC
jgi:protein TonB